MSDLSTVLKLLVNIVCAHQEKIKLKSIATVSGLVDRCKTVLHEENGH